MWTALFSLVACALQAPAAAPPSEAITALLESAAEGLRAELGIPGFALAVRGTGGFEWSAAYGWADLQTERAMTPSTPVFLASVTKVFTAAAAARLAEADALDLDAPIQTVLADYPTPEGGELTLRRLCGHLGGIRHYRPEDFESAASIERHWESNREALAIFADDPLVAPPGTRVHYSTFGYTLVSAVLEEVRDASILAILQGEVLDPLGLESCEPYRPERPDAPYARGYLPGSGTPPRPAPHLELSYKWGGGGLAGSVEDLVRFGAALLQPGVLLEHPEPPFAEPANARGRGHGVGLGWFLGTDGFGRPCATSNGSHDATRTGLALLPDEGLAVAFASSLGRTPEGADATALALAQAFLVDGIREAEPADLERWSGTWDLTAGESERASGTLELTAEGGRLTGSLSTPGMVSFVESRQGRRTPERMPVVAWATTDEGALGYAVGTRGLFPLRVVLDDARSDRAEATLVVLAGRQVLTSSYRLSRAK